jgi:PilZ domain
MGREKRKAVRRSARTPGLIFVGPGKPLIKCEVRDVSATGVQIALETEAPLPELFELAMSRDGKVRRTCVLVWQFSIMAGAEFLIQ